MTPLSLCQPRGREPIPRAEWDLEKAASVQTLLSPSSLCSPHDSPVNPRDEGLRRGRDLFRGAVKKIAGWCLRITIYWGPDASFFYRSEMRAVKKQNKKATILANISQNDKSQVGGVFIFFLPTIYRWAGF